MWTQISTTRALRAHLRGKAVKVVDLSSDMVKPLSEALERLLDGCVLYADTVAGENIEFSEAVDDMTETEKLRKQLSEMTDAYTELSVKYAELEAAQRIAENPAPKKKGHRNKTVAEIEQEYQSRKISDLEGLRALRAAGWSAKKLAEEFRCSEATVYNTLKKLEAKEETA